MDFDQSLGAALDERRRAHLFRQRRVLTSAQGPLVEVEGRRLQAFCSNDYLGLANHPRVIQAAEQGLKRYGVGSGASHLVSGHSEAHHRLEEELAAFTGRQRALVFSSGYMANLGVINALVGRGDWVFEDKLNHASLLDGGLLSGARFQRFAHNNCQHLAQRLDKAAGSGRKLVVVDGVFSMDGDTAPLTELVALCQQRQTVLMVDDAHGFGVLGQTGGGCAEEFALDQQQLPILMATLGKSLGVAGAFVAGSDNLIETLIQFARPYIYTTGMPPAVAEAARASLRLLQDEPWRRQQLLARVQQFRVGAERLQIPLAESQTAIQPVILGSEERVMVVSEQLERAGFWVGAIRPPTVPVGTSRLRITLSAAHSEQQVADLLATLAQVLEDVSCQ